MSKLPCLSKIYDEINRFEIGIDEAGRGPLFGRLYVAAAVLPKDNTFQHEKMRDSKTIKSRKKIQELSQYIKSNAVAWHIHYVDASVIDTINIRQAVLMAMHECAKQVIAQLKTVSCNPASENSHTFEREYMLLVDGNDFTPHMVYDEIAQSMREIQHETIEGGDNKYTCIAAASILAKNERDSYMEELCNTYPLLNERYGLAKNMGYGTKLHRDGIAQYGITQWHRKTYGICKTADVYFIPEEASP
uniref:Ribonuclease HII n=1 Tax=viral metagenome TaxID=1070528 RepID=A0A6C0HHF7_9ZZZZ